MAGSFCGNCHLWRRFHISAIQLGRLRLSQSRYYPAKSWSGHRPNKRKMPFASEVCGVSGVDAVSSRISRLTGFQDEQARHQVSTVL
jgi:hypothetical protein